MVNGFVFSNLYIELNIEEAMKIVEVPEMKVNELTDFITHSTQHMSWHVKTCTKLGCRVLWTKPNMP